MAAEFSLALNEEQQQLKDWVRDFARNVVRPAAEEWDEKEEFPWPVVEEAAKIGLYGFDFVAQAMLGDQSGLMMPLAIEELFWGDAGIGLAIMGTGLAAAAIAGNGTPEQMLEWIPQCYGTADDVKLGAFCVSEPDAGSDVSSLRTRAVYDEAKDEWTLNGTKAWITNGGIANIHVVVATVDPELRGRGQASFIIPPGTPGFSMGQKYKKHGIRASHTSEVVMDDVKIPGSCLLGGKDKLDEKLAKAREAMNKKAAGSSGKQPAMATFEATRPAVGAMAVGVAQAAYDYALEYALERRAFGKPIIQNQAIAFMLADMITEIDASRLLVHRAAWIAKNSKYVNAEGSQSKLKAGRTAVWVTERAIQILGGYGYTREYPVERMHRDSKIFDIFEGTEQIQQLVISRAISGIRIE
jgi:alkylation response protein AidB-like acyl-CoA dehydrogenase